MLRAIRTILYVVVRLIATWPTRRSIKKLSAADPGKANDLAQIEVKNICAGILKRTKTSLEVEGMENIPEEACLFVGNHKSYFDIVVIEHVLPRGTAFVGKDNFEKIPGFAEWMRLINGLFLDRKDVRKGFATIMEAAEKVKAGFSMCIFPEGTRIPEGSLGEFKGGSLKIAQKADCPIVPVAFSGTRGIYEGNGGFTVKPTLVKVTFGKPFKISELSKEEKRFAIDRVKNDIEEMRKVQNWPAQA